MAHNWFWIFERDTKEWHSFEQRLIKTTRKDGFKLEFVTLKGPDIFSRHNNILSDWDTKCWDNIVITGDVGRDTDFKDANGELLQLEDFTPWEILSYDEEDIRARIDRVHTIPYFPKGYLALLQVQVSR
jgi:hypothetical protein